MKKRIITVILLLVFIVVLVYGLNYFSIFVNQITGKVVEENLEFDSGNLLVYLGIGLIVIIGYFVVRKMRSHR
ncbi:MAG: hypothetical protein KKF56_04220 [Nanoarchaeota archaeon]|nr:hypothetical protein [Nanoarchaeota archaeon]